MHSDISITDKIYGILSDDKEKEQITGLGVIDTSNGGSSSVKLHRLIEMKVLTRT
jgi:hypothetical protein